MIESFFYCMLRNIEKYKKKYKSWFPSSPLVFGVLVWPPCPFPGNDSSPWIWTSGRPHLSPLMKLHTSTFVSLQTPVLNELNSIYIQHISVNPMITNNLQYWVSIEYLTNIWLIISRTKLILLSLRWLYNKQISYKNTKIIFHKKIHHIPNLKANMIS